MRLPLRLLTCFASLACTSLAYADGIGTPVNGSLFVTGLGHDSTNFFDPASYNLYGNGAYNGFVPAGAGNSNGPTATVGPGLEFGADFIVPGYMFTADFTGSTLNFEASSLGSLSPFEMDFIDPYFTSFTQLTNTVSTGLNLVAPPAFSYSFSGDTLKVLYSGTQAPGVIADTSFSYNQLPAVPVAATPEPSSFALLLTGLGGIAQVMRRRRLKP